MTSGLQTYSISHDGIRFIGTKPGFPGRVFADTEDECLRRCLTHVWNHTWPRNNKAHYIGEEQA